MKKIKVGLLTMSDGRIYLHEEYEQLNFEKQHAIAAALTATGLFEVVEGTRIINANNVAKEEGIRLREERGRGHHLQLHHLVLSAVYDGRPEFRARPVPAVL